MDSPQADAPKATRRVLLVDDEPDILVSLQRFIEKSIPNVKVHGAENAEQALKILKNETVDVIVSDYKMPGMNGLDFLSEARKLDPDVPRILVTAFPDLEVATRAINEARIHNFFTKPFDVVAIIEGVKNALEERAETLRTRDLLGRSLASLRKKVH